MIAPKAVKRFKERIREITRRHKSEHQNEMEELVPYMRGWGCPDHLFKEIAISNHSELSKWNTYWGLN